MEQWIHGHFREAQCMVVILEKPVAFVVKIEKISIRTNSTIGLVMLFQSNPTVSTLVNSATRMN
jgi:hypothetical protein